MFLFAECHEYGYPAPDCFLVALKADVRRYYYRKHATPEDSRYACECGRFLSDSTQKARLHVASHNRQDLDGIMERDVPALKLEVVCRQDEWIEDKQTARLRELYGGAPPSETCPTPGPSKDLGSSPAISISPGGEHGSGVSVEPSPQQETAVSTRETPPQEPAAWIDDTALSAVIAEINASPSRYITRVSTD